MFGLIYPMNLNRAQILIALMGLVLVAVGSFHLVPARYSSESEIVVDEVPSSLQLNFKIVTEMSGLNLQSIYGLTIKRALKEKQSKDLNFSVHINRPNHFLLRTYSETAEGSKIDHEKHLGWVVGAASEYFKETLSPSIENIKTMSLLRTGSASTTIEELQTSMPKVSAVINSTVDEILNQLDRDRALVSNQWGSELNSNFSKRIAFSILLSIVYLVGVLLFLRFSNAHRA